MYERLRLARRGPAGDWVWSVPKTAAGPVTGSPALFYPSYPTTSANDRLFVGSSTTRGPNFFALKNLYTTPTVDWQKTTAGLDGSFPDMDLQNQVYINDAAGTLWCYSLTGGLCSGWGVQSIPKGNGSSLTSPWVDFDTKSVFFADNGGKLYKVGTTAAGGASGLPGSSGILSPGRKTLRPRSRRRATKARRTAPSRSEEHLSTGTATSMSETTAAYFAGSPMPAVTLGL